MTLQVTVYTKPSCVQCKMTVKALEQNGHDVELLDLTDEGQAEKLEALKAEGFLSAPIVEAAGVRWSGFRPDLIASL